MSDNWPMRKNVRKWMLKCQQILTGVMSDFKLTKMSEKIWNLKFLKSSSRQACLFKQVTKLSFSGSE